MLKKLALVFVIFCILCVLIASCSLSTIRQKEDIQNVHVTENPSEHKADLSEPTSSVPKPDANVTNPNISIPGDMLAKLPSVVV